MSVELTTCRLLPRRASADRRIRAANSARRASAASQPAALPFELRQQYRRGRRERAQPGLKCRSPSLERLCPNVYTIHIVKEQSTGAKKDPGGVNRPGSLVGASLEGSKSEPSRNMFSWKATSSVPHYSWRANHNGQTQHAPVWGTYRTGARRRPHRRWHTTASAVWRRLLNRVVELNVS